MKATELRIGNFVYEYNDSVIINISCWEFEKARLENNQNELKWLNPIPLTEEWLVKFGFELVGKKTYYKLNIPLIPVRNSHYQCKGADIKYVHQLQNLYFALTNKEL